MTSPPSTTSSSPTSGCLAESTFGARWGGRTRWAQIRYVEAVGTVAEDKVPMWVGVNAVLHLEIREPGDRVSRSTRRRGAPEGGHMWWIAVALADPGTERLKAWDGREAKVTIEIPAGFAKGTCETCAGLWTTADRSASLVFYFGEDRTRTRSSTHSSRAPRRWACRER